jgi:hypothetical protein
MPSLHSQYACAVFGLCKDVLPQIEVLDSRLNHLRLESSVRGSPLPEHKESLVANFVESVLDAVSLVCRCMPGAGLLCDRHQTTNRAGRCQAAATLAHAGSAVRLMCA